MMRKSLLLLVVVVVAFSSSEDDEECSSECSVSKVRVGLEWFLNADHAPFVLAEKMGFFADQGLEVELVEPSDHWDSEAEVVAGRLDVVITEPLHLAKGGLVGFARFLHTDGGVMYFDDAIKRPRDMCGKTIQYPGAPGPGGPAIVQTMVLNDGGRCDLESYGRVNFGFEHVKALADKKADLATLIFSNFEIPAAIDAGHTDAKFFSLKDNGVPDFCQLVLATTRHKFQTSKPLLRKLLLALRKAVALIHADPESASALFQLASPDSPTNTIAATLPLFPNDNSMSLDFYHNLLAWLQSTHQLNNDSIVHPSIFWSNDIALP